MSSRTNSSSIKPWFWYIEMRVLIWPRLLYFNFMSTKGKLWTKTVFPTWLNINVTYWKLWNSARSSVLWCSSLSPSCTSCSWISWFAKIETLGPSTLQKDFSFQHFKIHSYTEEGFLWQAICLKSAVIKSLPMPLDIHSSIYSLTPFSCSFFLIVLLIHLFSKHIFMEHLLCAQSSIEQN